MDIQRARFWVRPYEFEGSGSSGAADEIAEVEIGGRVRVFWVKILDQRLFFREVARSEQWTFGTIQTIDSNVRQSGDLKKFLQQELEAERYGRVLLLPPPTCCFYLVQPHNVHAVIPFHGISQQSIWKSQQSAHYRPFLDWSLGVLEMLRHGGTGFDHTLKRQITVPTVRKKWIRGEASEFTRLINAFLHWYWTTIFPNSVKHTRLQWQLRSAWAFESMHFEVLEQMRREPDYPFSWPVDHRFNPQAKRLLRSILSKYLFVGQGVHGFHEYGPRTLSCLVEPPTNQEKTEARLILNDWTTDNFQWKHRLLWVD